MKQIANVISEEMEEMVSAARDLARWHIADRKTVALLNVVIEHRDHLGFV